MPARGTVPDKRVSSPALLRAQVAAFSKQVPVLYLLLSVNALALAYTFWDAAPLWLVAAPSPLLALSAARIVVWVRRRNAAPGSAEAERLLRTTVLLGPAIGMAMLVWALELHQYGSTAQQTHVTVFVGLTVVSCIFCLMHVRTAALGITSSVAIPYSVTLIFSRDPVLMAIGANMALVSLVMIYILFVYSSEFEQMIQAQAETQRLSDDNHRLANIDGLTGLPNRRQFFTRLSELLSSAEGEQRRFWVGLLDLDGFKPVNDLYGHLVGDQVLVETGARLQEIAQHGAFICRLGGDEFGVILDGGHSHEEVERFGQRVCEALLAPFSTLDVLAKISGTIGFAASDQGEGQAKLLYERADYALYHAKQNERGRAIMFSREHETAIRRLSVLEQSLRNADIDTEMSLVFQPMVDVATGRITTFEALARWDSPELGPVSPADFVPIAERTDLITRLTQALLQKALAEARRWPADIRISFNLSARDLSPEAILKTIEKVRASGLDASRIVFEITETAAMRDIALAEISLGALRARGARVALDDFGAGYSSLSYVRRLPLDRIKVDRGFIVDIEHDGVARDILKTIIDLSRNLKIDCVVEGVETEAQKRTIGLLGCTTMQGYLFSKPMTAGEIPDFLAGVEADRRTRLTVALA